MPQQAFRAIAPRRVPESPIPPPAPEEGKIKRASTACGECKRRRTKCSAVTTGIPCAECAVHNRECVIDEYADKRRKVAAKRTEEALVYYQGFLSQLLHFIRYIDGPTLTETMDFIRSGISDSEVLATVSRFGPRNELNVTDGVDEGDEVDGVDGVEDTDGVDADGVDDVELGATETTETTENTPSTKGNKPDGANPMGHDLILNR